MLIKMRAMMKRDQKGFTLIELIVVMGILAILAALAVPRFSTILEDSKFRAHNTNVDTIVRAIEMWNAQEDTPFASGDTVQKLVDKNYLKEIPDLPIKGMTTAGNKIDANIASNKGYEIKLIKFNAASSAADTIVPDPYKYEKSAEGIWTQKTTVR